MLAIFALNLLAFGELVQGECLSGCQEPVLIYDTLKCQPIYNSRGDCCPKQFNCSHIETRDDDHCYFKRRAYRVGEQINDHEIYGNCFIDCSCSDNRSGRKVFNCANLDCTEWLGLKPSEGCHFRYETNKCCSVGETCPPFSVKCKVNDKVYKEGEKFIAPDNKCFECVCGSGFRGKYEPPFCRKRECLEEITNPFKVKTFCAPSYIADECCPKQWICPSDDNIESIEKSPERNGPKCKFGSQLLSIGDKFERIHISSGAKLSCECRIPPYLTCIQDKSYPVYNGDY